MTESPILALQQQRMLLEIEYNVDKEEHRRQMEARGLDRLAKRGDAWLNVRFGRSYYNSLNQLSVELYRTQDQDIEHNFEFGRPVWIVRNEGLGMRFGNKNESNRKTDNRQKPKEKARGRNRRNR